MLEYLTKEQAYKYQEFKEFVASHVTPFAHEWDQQETIPGHMLTLCAGAGYLGGTIPGAYGGEGWNSTTFGLLNEAFGSASVSLTGLFNVHTMVAQTLLKWGTTAQQEKWLPLMAEGELLAAFALTEPNAGSDIRAIETIAVQESGGGYVLNGRKKWITFGAKADIFLVFGKLQDQFVAFLVERDAPGLDIKPIRNMLGFKAAHLATLQFENCRIDADNLIGKPGFALNYIAPYALNFGRISVAFAGLGLLRACFETGGAHAARRQSFDARLIEHQAVGGMIADMGVALRAATLLCLDASNAVDGADPRAMEKVLIAKYFTAKAAAEHASHAVQVLGAVGCHEDTITARCYRDAKTMEIIEGSNQIHQMLLSQSFSGRLRATEKTT
jgi:alkylation response protein AidB-like acyl-CoA dehydrogenase